MVTPVLNRFLYELAAVSYFPAFFFFSTFLVPFLVCAGGRRLAPARAADGGIGLHLLAAARGVWGHGRRWIERKRGRMMDFETREGGDGMVDREVTCRCPKSNGRLIGMELTDLTQKSAGETIIDHPPCP